MKKRRRETRYRWVSWILETYLSAELSVTDVDTSLNSKHSSSLLCEQPAQGSSATLIVQSRQAASLPQQKRIRFALMSIWISLELKLLLGVLLLLWCQVGPNGFLLCVPAGSEWVQGVRAWWDFRSYQDLSDLQVSCTRCCVALFVRSAGMQLCMMCSTSTCTGCLRDGAQGVLQHTLAPRQGRSSVV